MFLQRCLVQISLLVAASAWSEILHAPKKDIVVSKKKRPVGRPRMRWENNINHDLREADYTGDDWKSLAEDREVWRAYVHAVMNLRVR